MPRYWRPEPPAYVSTASLGGPAQAPLGPALQQLELHILRHDPSLELHAPPPRSAPVRYARTGDLNIAYREALALARAVGARRAELRALGVLGVDLAYLGHTDDGLATLRQALRLAEQDGAPEDVFRASAWLTDALTMLGRPRESARLAADALDVVRRYGIEHGPLTGNHFEALLAVGDWD